MINCTATHRLKTAMILTLVALNLQVYGQKLTPFGILDNSSDPALPAEQWNDADLPHVIKEDINQRTLSPTINCDANTFWLIRSGSPYITEYSLINSVITQTGNSYLSGGNGCLAYANENTGVTGLSPTFYATSTSGTPYLKAFNGTTWMNMATYPLFLLPNCSGYGDHVYVDGSNFSLYRYTNGNIVLHYAPPPGRGLMVADQAVDANGNVYFFTGNTTAPFIADSLIVMSPSGNIIKKYSVLFGANNPYGAFILNNTLYVGLGTSNVVFPGTLMPITFNQNSVTQNTPIVFPWAFANDYDLESCNQGVPVGLFAGIEVSEDLSMYPNPATDLLNIKIPNVPGIEIKEVSLISVHGQEIHPAYSRLDKSHVQLQFENFPPGLYFVKISDGKNVHYGKFEYIGK